MLSCYVTRDEKTCDDIPVLKFSHGIVIVTRTFYSVQVSTDDNMPDIRHPRFREREVKFLF